MNDLAVLSTVSMDWSVLAVMMSVPLAVVALLVLVTVVVLGLNAIIGVIVASVRVAETFLGQRDSRGSRGAGH